MVETYVRLIYTTPYAKNRFRLQKNLRGAEPVTLHTLIELLNFRLLRFFKYHKAIGHLFLDLHDCAMKTEHHQLYGSVENLLMKVLQNLQHVLPLRKPENIGKYNIEN